MPSQTDRQKAEDLLDSLRENSVGDKEILEHILYNWMSGSEELEALREVAREFRVRS